MFLKFLRPRIDHFDKKLDVCLSLGFSLVNVIKICNVFYLTRARNKFPVIRKKVIILSVQGSTILQKNIEIAKKHESQIGSMKQKMRFQIPDVSCLRDRNSRAKSVRASCGLNENKGDFVRFQILGMAEDQSDSR